MLSSAIKSYAFIPYKESCVYKSFARDISSIVTDHVKFYPKCFSFGILLQKSSSWFPSCTVKYISPECHNFSFEYLHMESGPGLIFKIISSLANLNLRTKFEIISIVKFLGKGIQEKLYFNNIVSIKSTFLAN